MKLTNIILAATTAAGLGLAGCSGTSSTTTNPVNVADVLSQLTSALKASCSTFVPVAENLTDIIEAALVKDPNVTSDTDLAKTLANSICSSVSSGPVATNASLRRGGMKGEYMVFKPVDNVPVEGTLLSK